MATVKESVEPKLDWPPKFRCENCGWWKRRESWFSRLFRRVFGGKEYGLGDCRQFRNIGPTWRSHVCMDHTASGSHYGEVVDSVRLNRRMIQINCPGYDD